MTNTIGAKPVYGGKELTRAERAIYKALDRAADKVAAEYDCEHCRFVNHCNDGASCVKDNLKLQEYMQSRAKRTGTK